MTVQAGESFVAVVVYTHDGDTFYAVVTLSRADRLYKGSMQDPQPIRLAGANAIELGQLGGREARDNLDRLIPPGSQIRLHNVVQDHYAGRWDAEVETADHPDLVQHLVDEGWLARYPGHGPKTVPPWPRRSR